MTTSTDATPNTAAAQPEVGEPKKKRKYSKRWKDTQKAERQLAKANRRVAKAVLAGFDRWNDARDKSASKKKDGSLKDMNKNVAKAVSKALEVSAKVPTDMARAMDKMVPKRFRLFR